MDKISLNYTIEKKHILLRIISFLAVSIILVLFIMYVYDYEFTFNTMFFIMLTPFMIISFFLSYDLMHPLNIFFITTQFLFVFNMIDLNANGDTFRYGSLSFDYREQAFFWAIFIIFLWYIFMYFGYLISHRITNSKPIKAKIFNIMNTKAISWILVCIGILSFSYIVFLKDGFSGIIQALTGRVEAYAGLTYFIKLTGLTTIGAIMLLSYGYRKTSMILILLSFIMLSSFGGRAAAFFGSIFPYIVFYHYEVKRLNIMKLAPLGVISLIFAIGLGNYRLYQEVRINFSGLYDLLSMAASSVQGGEILPSLVGSIIKGNIDYQYGATLINIIFAPIPSSIWTNKPPIDESGIVGRALMGSDYWGLPPGPYGISFFNFGFIGVIIAAFLIGIIVYKLYYKFILLKVNNPLGKLFYILIIPSVFNLVSTSAQINIIWYIGVFLGIKFLDVLITSTVKRA